MKTKEYWLTELKKNTITSQDNELVNIKFVQLLIDELNKYQEDSARIDHLEKNLKGSFEEIGHITNSSQLEFAAEIQEFITGKPFYIGSISRKFGRTLREAIDLDRKTK